MKVAGRRTCMKMTMTARWDSTSETRRWWCALPSVSAPASTSVFCTSRTYILQTGPGGQRGSQPTEFPDLLAASGPHFTRLQAATHQVLKEAQARLKRLRLPTISMQLRWRCCQLELDCTAAADPLVGVQLVLEGGGGNGLLPRDAARWAAHHVAHVHDRRDQLLATLRVWCPLRSQQVQACSGLGFGACRHFLTDSSRADSTRPRVQFCGWLGQRNERVRGLAKAEDSLVWLCIPWRWPARRCRPACASTAPCPWPWPAPVLTRFVDIMCLIHSL